MKAVEGVQFFRTQKTRGACIHRGVYVFIYTHLHAYTKTHLFAMKAVGSVPFARVSEGLGLEVLGV